MAEALPEDHQHRWGMILVGAALGVVGLFIAVGAFYSAIYFLIMLL